MRLSDAGEFGLISRLHAGLKTRAGTRLGIGDDGAVLDSLATPVVTADALVEGVHFRLDWSSATQLGRKSLAVNVSDLAAMGAQPRAAFVCLALPAHLDVEWVQELYAGMEEVANEYGFTVAGGDTVSSPGPAMISVTLVGEALGQPLLRTGAKPGDVLVVSGTLGDSAAGLHLLLHPTVEVPEEASHFLIERHLAPEPRMAQLNRALERGVIIHAALDLSDGLAGDVLHLANRSGVGVEIDVEALPISVHCRQVAQAAGRDPLAWALSGGEDFELLLAVPPHTVSLLQQNPHQGVAWTPVGRCTPKETGARFLRNGLPLENLTAGYTHF